jgi:hypothetical protein
MPASFFSYNASVLAKFCKPLTALALLNTFKNMNTNKKIMHAGVRAERRDSALHSAEIKFPIE